MTLDMMVQSFIGTHAKAEKERRKKLQHQAAIVRRMAAIRKLQRTPDWAQNIQDILDAGVESVGLSMAVGKSKSWADNYIRSSTKKMDYSVGTALLAIHREYVK